MSKPGLVRVDSRLLHGQVVTRWIGNVGAKEVIILDDELAQDEFMIEVFKMSAPSGVELYVKPINDDTKAFLDDRDLSHSIILFNSIPHLLKGLDLPIDTDDVQIGGIGGSAERKVVYKNITLTKEEYDQLKTYADKGFNIYLQTVPDDHKVSLVDIAGKF